MRDHRDPVVKLRVGVARIAQQCGYEHRIPGITSRWTEDANFEQLTHAAQTEERGWNALLACIADVLEG